MNRKILTLLLIGLAFVAGPSHAQHNDITRIIGKAGSTVTTTKEGSKELLDVSAGFGDSIGLDAFQRLRVSNQRELFDNKNIHDRRKNQWEEPITGAIIEHGAVTGGPFQVGEIVTGAISGTIGTVTAVDASALTITYTVNHNDFEVIETITGGTSSATADTSSVNTGSHIIHSRNEASVTLQVGQMTGDTSVRTTHRYFPYTPGKSHQIMQTFVFGDAVENVRRRVGYFSPNNGIFFEQDSDGIRFVRRTKTSGSIVDNKIEQTNWNADTFDLTGPSGATIDTSKIQLLFTDFSWLGTGRIRLGFMVDGRLITAHNINTTNTLAVPWMSTPSLPVRYEISNTELTSSTNTMKEFCSTVVSEGVERQVGIGFSIANEITSRAVTTEVPILAIRLKNTFGTGDGENRRTIQFSSGGIFPTTNAAHFEIRHLHDPTGITATWTDVGGGSAVEYSTDITAVTGNPSNKIEEGYAGSGQAGKGGQENTITGDKLDQHRFATQNIDSNNSEMFVIFSTSISGTSNVYAHMNWIEID